MAGSQSKAVELARLFVSVVPSFNGIEGNLGAQLGAPLAKESKKAGEESGKSFGSSFGDHVKQAVLAVGIGEVVKKSFETAIDQQKGTNKMAASMGLSAEDSAAYGKVAGELYANAYGDSMEQVNEAVDAVGSSLVRTGMAGKEDLKGLTGQAMSLATALGSDVGEATNTAGILVHSGLAKNAKDAFDLLAKAGQSVPAQMRQEIFPVMDEYSKHFQGLGIDGKTAMGMIVAASADGAIGMDKVGDAVKEFGLRAVNPTTNASNYLKEVGVDAVEVSRKIAKGGADGNAALKEVANGLLKIQDPAKLAQAGVEMFGTQFEDLGVNNIPTMLKALAQGEGALKGVEGAADGIDKTMSAGAGSSMEQFGRKWEQTLGGLAAKMLPTISLILDKLLPIIDGMEPFAPLLIGVAVAFGVLAAAMWVASLTPITLIIGAIITGLFLLGAGLTWIGMHWGEIWTGMSIVMGGFFNWAGEVLGGFANWWNEVWGGFGNWVGEVWGGFTNWIKEIWDGFTNWIGIVVGGFMNWWNEVWGGFGNWVGEIWGGMVNGIKQVWDGFITWITPGWRVWAKITDTAWRLMADGVKLVWGGFINWLKEIWDGFMTWIQGGLNWFAGVWNAFWAPILKWASDTWAAISGAVTKAWAAVSAAVNAGMTWLSGVWKAFWTPIANTAVAVWNTIAGAVASAWNTVVGWIRSGIAAVTGIWTAAWNFVSGVFTGVWNHIAGFFGTVWATVTGALKKGIDDVLGFFGSMGTNIGNFFGGLWNSAYDWGKNIIDGLLNGLHSMAGNIGDFFLHLLPGWIVDPFKEALDIHSPSRVFFALGENTGDGYLNGAESKKDLIKKSMETMVAIPPTPKTSMTPAPAAAPYQAPAGDTYEIHPAPGMDEVLLAQHISNNNRRAARR